MLGSKKGKQLRRYVKDYVLFDLETTGISCNYDEIIEISAVKVRDGKVIDEFSTLVNPLMPIPRAASRVNNITDDMVAFAPTFEEVLPMFIEFVGDDVLVGHNIKTFDMKFIYRDCEKYFSQTITNDYVDTLQVAKVCFPKWKHRRLSDLAEHYNISTVGAHRALQDCRMNQQVFELLGKELENINITAPKEEEYIVSALEAELFGGVCNVTNKESVRLCPDCGKPMKKRSGRYGEFWGCTGFPKCRHTENT